MQDWPLFILSIKLFICCSRSQSDSRSSPEFLLRTKLLKTGWDFQTKDRSKISSYSHNQQQQNSAIGKFQNFVGLAQKLSALFSLQQARSKILLRGKGTPARAHARSFQRAFYTEARAGARKMTDRNGQNAPACRAEKLRAELLRTETAEGYAAAAAAVFTIELPGKPPSPMYNAPPYGDRTVR